MATEGAIAEAPVPDLGDFAQFVSPAPPPSTGSPTPTPAPTPDLGDFAQFVSPVPSPAPDLGDFAQFVSTTPHASNALGQTYSAADEVAAATPEPRQMVIPRMGTMGVSSELMGLDADQPMPSWAKNAMEGLGETALGLVPHSPQQAVEMASPIFGSYHELAADAKTVRDLVSGVPFDQAFVQSHPDVPELEEALQTPPFSKQRFKAGFTMMAKFGMLAAGGAQLRGGERGATTKGQEQKSVQAQPESRVEGGQAQEAGPGDSLQPAATLGPEEIGKPLNLRYEGFQDYEGAVPNEHLYTIMEPGPAHGATFGVREGGGLPELTARLEETKTKFSQPAGEGGETVPETPSPDIAGGGAPPEISTPARGPMSLGMASPEEFMQRYSSVGASEILKGNTDPAGFANAVKAEFGSHINDMIPEIRARSEQLINEMQTATGKTDVSREVNRLVGVTKMIEQPERVRLFSTLQDSLRQQEKAGEAGFKRGFKEASVIGNEKTRAMRQKARTADAFLAADAQAVRDALVDYSKNLPLHERGKFIPAITSATKRVPIWSRDPGVMYRRAEAVLNRMTEAMYQVEKKAAIADIAKRLQKIEDSPSVSVGQKQAARQVANTFNNFKDKMSFDMLERMHESIKDIEAKGRTEVEFKETMREIGTEVALNEMNLQGTLRLDKPVPVKVPIGEEKSLAQRQVERVGSIPAAIRHFNLAWTPMDFVFQTFDQKFNGALYRTMKLPIDMKYGNFLDIARGYKDTLTSIVKKHGLTEGNLNRITAVGELRQEGGLENLMSRGFTEKELKDIRLSKGELEYLREADKINDDLLPKVREVMKDSFNQEIEKVQGYWPRQRDWDYYNSLSITEGKFANGMRRVAPEKGHTVSRTGAVTKNVLNAHEIMMKHIDDVVYHMEMAPEIRRVADIIKTPEFQNQVGTWGQKVFADWLDVIARNGGIEAGRRMPAIDTIRKNIGMAQLAWRITTTGLQPLAIIDGMGYTSTKSMGRALTRMMSKEHRQWVLNNAPEIRARVGDDPAYTDFQGRGIRGEITYYGYKGITTLDRFSAMTVFDAAYYDYLVKNNLQMYIDNPKLVHMGALQHGQMIVRRSQASALPKDQPQALSRGAFTDNASLDRMLGQFQSFMIRKWATVKNDAFQMGIKEKNIRAGARVMTFAILGTIVEQMGREGIAAMTRAIVGESERQRKRREGQGGAAQRIAQNSMVDFITGIPMVSNTIGAITYQGTGIPTLDVIGKATAGIPQMVTGKSVYSRGVGAVRTGQALGAIAGIPTGQAGDLMIKWIQSAEAEAKGGKTVRLAKPKK